MREIDENASSILINGKQKISSFCQSYARDISPMRKWKGERLISVILIGLSKGIVIDRYPYFKRLKVVMRLPTGDSKEDPSGVKSIFPLQ